MTFTNENFTGHHVSFEGDHAAIEDRAAFDDPAAGRGLIGADVDLEFHADERPLCDVHDIVDEMRPDLPNLAEISRSADGTRVTLRADAGETLVFAVEVIERGHRHGRRAVGLGWRVEASDAAGGPVPIPFRGNPKIAKTADDVRRIVSRMFSRWVGDDMRRARARRRSLLKRMTRENRSRAIQRLEELHLSLRSGDRETHRGSVERGYWYIGFDDPGEAFGVLSCREGGRNVLRAVWLDLTGCEDSVNDLRSCPIESIDAAEIIGEDAADAIIEWDDETYLQWAV